MPPKSKKNGQLRTIDVVAPDGQTIAPRSLIEVSGPSHWTAETHKIWWTLLDHAWGDRMDKPGEQFEIDTAALRFGGHDSNDRLGEHLLRIQKTVLSVPVEKRRQLRVQMIGSTVMGKDENAPGILRYDWPINLVKVLRNPAKYGKIELRTVTAMRSAYAIRLYTVIAARFAERQEPRAELSVDELREWLGVASGKLSAWSDLKKRAIDPALTEVNALCPLFSVQIDPVKIGKAVRRVVVTWDAKPAFTDMEQRAVAEVNRHKAGRKARINGTAETVVQSFPESGRIDLDSFWKPIAKSALPLLPGTNTTAALDLVGSDFIKWTQRKGIPLDAPRIQSAFEGFCRQYKPGYLAED